MNDRSPSRSTDDAAAPSAPSPSLTPNSISGARDFIVGTGRMYSLLGLVLMLVSGGIGLFGGGLLDLPREPAETFREHFTAERMPFTLKALSLFAAFIGGLAMQAVGLALSSELGRGAVAGLVVSELISLTWLFSGLLLLLGGSSQTVAGILLGIMGVAMTGPSLFALRCVLLSRDLPPVDRGRLGREAWEAYQKRRRPSGE